MPYDYHLVGGVLILMFAFVGVANALVERRSPVVGLIGVIVGGFFVFWAWQISGQGLSWDSVPNAVFRIISDVI